MKAYGERELEKGRGRREERKEKGKRGEKEGKKLLDVAKKVIES